MGYWSFYHSILTEMEAKQTTIVAPTKLIATSSCPKCYVHLRNYTRYIFSWLTTCYLDDSHWQNFLTHSEGKRNLNFQYGIINDCKIQQKLKFTYEFSNNLHGRNIRILHFRNKHLTVLAGSSMSAPHRVLATSESNVNGSLQQEYGTEQASNPGLEQLKYILPSQAL